MQQSLFGGDDEAPEFLKSQLLTYIGNKRALLGNIEQAVQSVRERLGGRRLTALDPFAGSGAVSRLLKKHAKVLHSSDLEAYATALGRTYLANADDVDMELLNSIVAEMNEAASFSPRQDGFIRRMYSPPNDQDIKQGDRAFYTNLNAARLDTYRDLIHALPNPLKEMLLGPLLVKASIHANTGGVFKGFYKDRGTGIGKFGGTKADALSRIAKPISLETPILSRFYTESHVYQSDATSIAGEVGEVDFAYLDPPYNQHPYGSNYFMLNLIAENKEPGEVSEVSGIPRDWRRSPYYVKSRAADTLRELLESLQANFVLISYSDEGFVSPREMTEMLKDFGSFTVWDTPYPTFRASRNLAARSLSVTEHLYLLERD